MDSYLKIIHYPLSPIHYSRYLKTNYIFGEKFCVARKPLSGCGLNEKQENSCNEKSIQKPPSLRNASRNAFGGNSSLPQKKRLLLDERASACCRGQGGYRGAKERRTGKENANFLPSFRRALHEPFPHVESVRAERCAHYSLFARKCPEAGNSPCGNADTEKAGCRARKADETREKIRACG